MRWAKHTPEVPHAYLLVRLLLDSLALKEFFQIFFLLESFPCPVLYILFHFYSTSPLQVSSFRRNSFSAVPYGRGGSARSLAWY